jgi:hypothetical protein
MYQSVYEYDDSIYGCIPMNSLAFSLRNKGQIPFLMVLWLGIRCLGQPVPLPAPAVMDDVGLVTFLFRKTATTINLADYASLHDSCAALDIVFLKPAKVRVSLMCNRDHLWSLVLVDSPDSLRHDMTVTTTLVNRDSLTMKDVQIRCTPDAMKDTVSISGINELPQVRKDDSTVTLLYEVHRNVFICPEHPQAKTEDRVFTYPAWYMKREPALNYPELSMFHYGKSIKVPTDESVRLRGILINYWHIQHPPDLTYEDPKRSIPEKRSEPKRKKKPFFTIKPLR